MNNLDDLEKLVNTTLSHDNLYQTKVTNLASVKIVNYIFERLSGIIPAYRYNAELSIDSIKREYLQALIKNGKIKTIEQINKGLDKIRDDNLTFLPSPATFIKYCLDSDKKIPSLYEAYAISIAINRQYDSYIHPDADIDKLIRHVVNQIGAANYRTMPGVEARKTFESYYQLAVEDFKNDNLKDMRKMIASTFPGATSYKVNSVSKRFNELMKIYKSKTKEQCFEIMINLLIVNKGLFKRVV